MNDMECKYRDEITGKRFLAVRSCGKLKATKISEWEWRSGIVRAVTHKDFKDQDISVRYAIYYEFIFRYFIPNCKFTICM